MSFAIPFTVTEMDDASVVRLHVLGLDSEALRSSHDATVTNGSGAFDLDDAATDAWPATCRLRLVASGSQDTTRLELGTFAREVVTEGDATISDITSAGYRAQLVTTVNEPAKHQYRRVGESAWRTRDPFETSADFGADSPHTQGVPGDEAFPYAPEDELETRWLHGAGFAKATGVQRVTLLAGGGGGGGGNPNADPDWPAVQSSIVSPADNLGGAPARLQDLTEATGVKLRRVTDHDDYTARSIGARHQYSRRPAWSRSGLWLSIGERTVDATNFNPENLWNATSRSTWGWTSDHFYGFEFGGSKLYKMGPNNGGRTLLRDFSNDGLGGDAKFGKGEGNLSADDRYVVITGNGKMVVYDLVNDAIVGGPTSLVNDHNWTGIGLSGAYVIGEENDGNARRWWRFDRNLGNRFLLHDYNEHCTFVLDEHGDDWLLAVDDPSNQGKFVAIRLRDAAKLIFNDGGFGHLSGHVLDRPGWSAFNRNPSEGGEVGMVRVAIAGGSIGSETINGDGYSTTRDIFNATNEYSTWGYHRSTQSSYLRQAQGSARADGKRILIASDWRGDRNPEAYEFRVD